MDALFLICLPDHNTSLGLCTAMLQIGPPVNASATLRERVISEVK